MRLKDTDIYQQVQLPAKDMSVFSILYESCWYDLYKTAYFKTADKQQAQDIVQELFITIWNNGIPEKAGRTIREYLFSALRNRILNYFRDQAVQEKHRAALDEALAILPDTTTSLAEVNDLGKLIEREISQMPRAVRTVYRMSREEGYSAADIAHKLKVSPQTVRNQISVALKRIRSILDGESIIVLAGLLVPLL